MKRRNVGKRVGAAAVAIGLAIASLTIGAAPAQAYCKFGTTWTSPGTTKYLAGYSTNIPTAMRPAINAASVAYNLTSGSTLKVGSTTYYSTADSFAAQPFKISLSDPGEMMPASTPGVTWRGSWNPGTDNLNKAQVYLNPGWTWSTSFNQSTKKADTATVVIHELGHAHGLAHPWDTTYCTDGGSLSTAETASVMNATFTNKRTLTSDDIAGLASLYLELRIMNKTMVATIALAATALLGVAGCSSPVPPGPSTTQVTGDTAEDVVWEEYDKDWTLEQMLEFPNELVVRGTIIAIHEPTSTKIDKTASLKWVPVEIEVKESSTTIQGETFTARVITSFHSQPELSELAVGDEVLYLGNAESLDSRGELSGTPSWILKVGAKGVLSATNESSIVEGRLSEFTSELGLND